MGNIFAPSELISCFGLQTLSIECLPAISAGIIWKIFLSIMPRTQELLHPVFLP